MATVRHLGLFPWCVNQDTSFFKGDDLKTKAVPIWWRVKKWELNASGVFMIFGEIEYQFSGSDTLNVTDLDIDTITKKKYTTEKDLVCAGVFYDEVEKKQYRPQWNHFFGTSLGGTVIDSFIKIGPNFEMFFDQDGAYPFTTTEGNYECGSIVLTMNSLSFSIPMFSQESQATISGTLEATEYWTYDPGDGGGPIYDSTTGAQLRAFPAN